MSNLHKLSDCIDMTKEQFQECFKRIDMKMFNKNPTQAMKEAGIIFKEGFSFKLVKNQEEANALPDNVFPLIHNQKELSMEHLDKIVGGDEYGVPYVSDRDPNRGKTDMHW